jgi:hypothetical protein
VLRTLSPWRCSNLNVTSAWQETRWLRATGLNDRWFCTRCSLHIFEDSILTLQTCHSSGVLVRISRSGKLLLVPASTVLVSGDFTCFEMGRTLRREEGSTTGHSPSAGDDASGHSLTDLPSHTHTRARAQFPVNCCFTHSSVSFLWLTIDGVRIGNWIYCTTSNYSAITNLHTTVYFSTTASIA